MAKRNKYSSFKSNDFEDHWFYKWVYPGSGYLGLFTAIAAGFLIYQAYLGEWAFFIVTFPTLILVYIVIKVLSS